MGWLWSPCCDILPPAFTGFVGIPLLNTPQRNLKCGFDLFILGTHMESIQYYFRMVQKLWKRVKHGKTMLKSQLSMVQPAFFRWSPPFVEPVSQGAADQRRHKMWCPKDSQDVGVSENRFHLDYHDHPWPSLTHQKKVFYPCGFWTCTNVWMGYFECLGKRRNSVFSIVFNIFWSEITMMNQDSPSKIRSFAAQISDTPAWRPPQRPCEKAFEMSTWSNGWNYRGIIMGLSWGLNGAIW